MKSVWRIETATGTSFVHKYTYPNCADNFCHASDKRLPYLLLHLSTAASCSRCPELQDYLQFLGFIAAEAFCVEWVEIGRAEGRLQVFCKSDAASAAWVCLGSARTVRGREEGDACDQRKALRKHPALRWCFSTAGWQLQNDSRAATVARVRESAAAAAMVSCCCGVCEGVGERYKWLWACLPQHATVLALRFCRKIFQRKFQTRKKVPVDL